MRYSHAGTWEPDRPDHELRPKKPPRVLTWAIYSTKPTILTPEEIQARLPAAADAHRLPLRPTQRIDVHGVGAGR